MEPPPLEWVVSRICQEFPALTPGTAVGILNDPESDEAEWIITILRMRAYADTKQALEHAQSDQDVPSSPLVDLVKAIMAEEIRGEMARRRDHE